MFDLDPVKLLLIAVVALLVLGPDKLPAAAKKASSLMADLQRLRTSLHDEVHSTLHDLPLVDDLRDVGAAAQRLRDPRQALYRAVGLGSSPGHEVGADDPVGQGQAVPGSIDLAPSGTTPAEPAPDRVRAPVHADFDPSTN